MRDPFAQAQFDYTDRLRAEAEIAENVKRYKENEMSTKLINPNLPTVAMSGMHPLIHFLAKVQKGTPPLGSLNTPPTVSILRYGNRTQAEAKRQTLAARIMQDGFASAVVQVKSRFLIAIFPAEYDLDQKSLNLVRKGNAALQNLAEVERAMAYQPARRRPPFATVSGRRFNPRNRHNQNLPDDGSGPVYCQQSIPRAESKTVRDLLAKGTATDRRAAYRAASDRLNGRGQ